MLWEQVSLQQSGADQVLGEGKPLCGMAQDGVTYLQHDHNVKDKNYSVDNLFQTRSGEG